MYVIVNTSGRHLSIGDLRIVLTPRERIDLDSVCERNQIEESSSLRDALKKGFVKVVIKDRNPSENLFNNQATNASSALTKNDLEKLKIEIKEIIKEVISSMPSSENISREIVKDKKEDLELALDKNVLDQIHKKTIERIMESAEVSEVKSNSIKINSNIKNNLDELEGLL